MMILISNMQLKACYCKDSITYRKFWCGRINVKLLILRNLKNAYDEDSMG